MYHRAPQPEGDLETIPPVVMFERVGNETDDLSVRVRTQVIAALVPEAVPAAQDLKNGMNTLQILFVYDDINQKWYIQSIMLVG